MKQMLSLAMLFFACSLHAQSWSLNGNAGTTLKNKLGTISNVSLRFVTNNQERMKIHYSGNVGIGTPSPEQKLHVNGTAAFMNGSVGIGTTSPTAKLDIFNTSDFYGIKINNSFTALDDYIAINATSINDAGYGIGLYTTGGFYGLRSYGNGSNAPWSVYGVYGEANGTAGSRYGVYGYATGGDFNAAGYFDGDVYATNYLSISDRKFKTDITQLQNALDKLMRLNPASYRFKTDENPKMGLPKGEQVGLIADEVKQVFPQLVNVAVRPAKYDKDRSKLLSPEVSYEAVNYVGLVPVVISAIQEQQQQIQALKKKADKVDALEKELAELKALLTKNNGIVSVSSAYLESAVPNPSHGTTVIRYQLPEAATAATLILVNQKGQTLKTIALTSRGAGQVNLNTSELASGVYTCTLWANGREVASKQLVVTK